MRLKIDLEIPQWTKWLAGGIVIGLALGLGAWRVYAAAVSVKTDWKPNTALKADDLNNNFKALQDAINNVHVPDYDSGWVAENTNTIHSRTFSHNLGIIPSRVVIQVSTRNDGSWARIASGQSGFNTAESPESNWVSPTQMELTFLVGDNFIYCGDGWPCPADVATSKSGYVRVLMWK